jgi:serine/threonine protein kinase
VRDIGDGTGGAETFVGTFTYMSPERISGGSYSYAADIWSLGLTIMTCVFGKFPYSERSYWGLLNEIRDNPAPTLPGKFSLAMVDFLAKCLAKDPSNVRPKILIFVYFSLYWSNDHISDAFLVHSVLRPKNSYSIPL